MRALLITIAAVFVTGCATAPAGERIAVYDHKSNLTRYAYRTGGSDFVGTSANAADAAKTKPPWYRFGHP